MARFIQNPRWGAYAAAAVLAIACSSQSGGMNSSASTGSGGANQGGASASSGPSSSSSSSSTGMLVSAVSSGTGGTGGSAPFVCDPPAEAGSLYEHSAVSYDINDIDPVSMCKYRGKVLLVVNTAAA